jgi:hypothetical protein
MGVVVWHPGTGHVYVVHLAGSVTVTVGVVAQAGFGPGTVAVAATWRQGSLGGAYMGQSMPALNEVRVQKRGLVVV